MRFLFLISLLIFSTAAMAEPSHYENPIELSISNTSTKLVNAKRRCALQVINNDEDISVSVKPGSSVHSSDTDGVPIPPGGNWEPPNPPDNALYFKTIGSGSGVSVTVNQGGC